MRKVEVITDIKAKPEDVLLAFTDTDMLKDWWNVQRTLIDKRPGGLYTLAWDISDKGFGFISTGIIKEYRYDQLIVVDNLVYLNPGKPFLGPMQLTVSVKAKSNTSEFYLCQDGYQTGEVWNWYYEAVKQAWPIAIQTLKTYLEGRK